MRISERVVGSMLTVGLSLSACGGEDVAVPNAYSTPIIGNIAGSETVDAQVPLEQVIISNESMNFDGAPRFNWNGEMKDLDYTDFVSPVCDREGITDCVISAVNGTHQTPVDSAEKNTVQAVDLSFELSFTEAGLSCSATMNYLLELQVDRDMPVLFGPELTFTSSTPANC